MTRAPRSARLSFGLRACAVCVLSVAAGCTNTAITVLTQAPPGRTAQLDVDTRTLTVSRGLAVVLECSEYDDAYSGPCRDLDVDVDGDDSVDVFPVHLDALAGQTVNDTSAFGEESLSAPAPRRGVLLAAKTAGTSTLTLTASAAPVQLDLVVVAAPDDAAEDAPDDAPDDGE